MERIFHVTDGSGRLRAESSAGPVLDVPIECVSTAQLGPLDTAGMLLSFRVPHLPGFGPIIIVCARLTLPPAVEDGPPYR